MDVQVDPPEQFDWELVFIGLVIYVLHHLNEPASQWYIRTLESSSPHQNMNNVHWTHAKLIYNRNQEHKLSLFWFLVSFLVEHYSNVVVFGNNLKMVWSIRKGKPHWQLQDLIRRLRLWRLQRPTGLVQHTISEKMIQSIKNGGEHDDDFDLVQHIVSDNLDGVVPTGLSCDPIQNFLMSKYRLKSQNKKHHL